MATGYRCTTCGALEIKPRRSINRCCCPCCLKFGYREVNHICNSCMGLALLQEMKRAKEDPSHPLYSAINQEMKLAIDALLRPLPEKE